MAILDFDHELTDRLYLETLSGWQQDLLFGVAGFFIYLLPIVLVVLFFRSAKDRVSSLKLTIAATLAWLIFSNLLGWWLYNEYGFRARPFSELGLTELFFERPEKAFPSDHAAVLMAAALGLLAYNYSKLGWIFLLVAIISSVARVMIGFHWFGDILAGWLIGAMAIGLVVLFDRPLTQIINRVLSFYRR